MYKEWYKAREERVILLLPSLFFISTGYSHLTFLE